MIDSLKSPNRAVIAKRIRALPQAHLLDDGKIKAWIDQVLTVDPARALWHVERLAGIGGSEIGVLWGAEKGLYHPFSSSYDIVAAKMLDRPVTKSNGPMKFGILMEPHVQQIVRSNMTGRFNARDDLIAKIGSSRFEDAPWLIGNPDDVFDAYVEDGKIWIIDYKAPQPDTFAHLRRSGVPFYYEAQLHHYGLIAEKAGYQIGGLMLAVFDIKDPDQPLMLPMAYNPKTAEEILNVGNKYWNDYVMRGRPAPTPKLSNAVNLSELDDTGEVSKHIKDFVFFRNTSLAAGKESDDLAAACAVSLPALSHEVDKVFAGGCNLKIIRDWDVQKTKAKLYEMMSKPGTSTSEIDAFIQRTAMTDVKFDLDRLVNLIKEAGINPEEAYPDAIISQPQIRVDVLVAFLRQIDVNHEINFNELILRQKIVPELSRRKEVILEASEQREATIEHLRNWESGGRPHQTYPSNVVMPTTVRAANDVVKSASMPVSENAESKMVLTMESPGPGELPRMKRKPKP